MEMQEFIISAAGVAVAALGVFLTIHHHHRAAGYLGVSLNPSAASNSNGMGTYLAAIVTISNMGRESAFFGGFHALDKNSEYWYPTSTIEAGLKLEPGQFIQGSITAAALSKARVLWVVDGTGKRYRVNRFLLKRTVKFLKQESARWKSLGFKTDAS